MVLPLPLRLSHTPLKAYEQVLLPTTSCAAVRKQITSHGERRQTQFGEAERAPEAAGQAVGTIRPGTRDNSDEYVKGSHMGEADGM